MKSSDICVFTSVCGDDLGWTEIYLEEISRLKMPFVIYFDRCKDVMKSQMGNHPNCLTYLENDNPDIEFQENHKQKIFEKIPRSFKYALSLDIDEVLEKDALEKIEQLPDADYLDVVWVNCWGDEKHLRVGDGFGPRPRTKFYNIKRDWRWLDPVTNGPIMFIDGKRVDSPSTEIDLVCVHRGLMTGYLRRQHKERWDRIYTKAIGRQPYKLWEVAVDESIVPQIIENKYL